MYNTQDEIYHNVRYLTEKIKVTKDKIRSILSFINVDNYYFGSYKVEHSRCKQQLAELDKHLDVLYYLFAEYQREYERADLETLKAIHEKLN